MFEDEDFKRYAIENIPLGRMAEPEYEEDGIEKHELKEIIEADMALATEYVWTQNSISSSTDPDSVTGEPGKMDVENIATHEFGHFVGLGGLYSSTNSEQTQYGYSNYAELKKRSLESGDIAGVQKNYGL